MCKLGIVHRYCFGTGTTCLSQFGRDTVDKGVHCSTGSGGGGGGACGGGGGGGGTAATAVTLQQQHMVRKQRSIQEHLHAVRSSSGIVTGVAGIAPSLCNHCQHLTGGRLRYFQTPRCQVIDQQFTYFMELTAVG